MNKHIELVKKWLADPTSVTQQELEDNHDAAYAAYAKAYHSAAASYADAASYAAASYASCAAVCSYTNYTKHWVKRYEELKEQGE
jgi:uncharacterized protein with PIN domain